MPDLHSGYGFAIGNVAAVDMDSPHAVVSPGGVGFDINCGVSWGELFACNLPSPTCVCIENLTDGQSLWLSK